MADDKIKALDPAAAPLATDSEGAGTPIPLMPDHSNPDYRQRRGTDPLGLMLVATAIALAIAGVVTGILGLP